MKLLNYLKGRFDIVHINTYCRDARFCLPHTEERLNSSISYDMNRLFKYLWKLEDIIKDFQDLQNEWRKERKEAFVGTTFYARFICDVQDILDKLEEEL